MKETQDKYEFRVMWEPYFLRPNTPEEGMKIPYKPQSNASLVSAGKAVGIDFTGASQLLPNTAQAHTLLEFAKMEDSTGKKQNDLQEIFFKAFFTDGTPFDVDFLLQATESVGLNKDAAKVYLEDQENKKTVIQKALDWNVKGISGVPTFYMNEQKVFSGAQDEHTFIRMFEIISERFPAVAPASPSNL